METVVVVEEVLREDSESSRWGRKIARGALVSRETKSTS